VGRVLVGTEGGVVRGNFARGSANIRNGLWAIVWGGYEAREDWSSERVGVQAIKESTRKDKER
jgi:hypothetical protein